jgi:biopolymer transport protein ExbD
MVNQGIIKTTSFHSVIGSSSVLKPQGEQEKRGIVAELLLTALIDAFSILVIFLLMSFSSSGEILYVGKNMELPKSIAAEQLTRQPVVKIENGKIYLEGRELTQDQLLTGLIDLKKSLMASHSGDESASGLTVQGDRRLRYEMLNGIVLAASQAGFSDIKFAVVVN